ncbi:MAG: immune inhibitor A [Herpetosiphonaceae bacterium]|nr:immune inhibitor A [Herpetosiphonaceae bacterium]
MTIAPSPTPASSDDRAAVQAAYLEATPRDPLALARSWGVITETVALPVRPPANLGDREAFWVTNVETDEHFQVEATLRVQSPHLAFYLADGISVDDAVLQAAATTFESQSWALFSQWFDAAALPSAPITVLNAAIPGVGGYYAADNELPRALNRYSNEREIIFINANAVDFAGAGYVGVLTHEIQHLLHRNALSHPATWFNEGASMLSEDRTGVGNDGLVSAYLANPDLQLNAWADSPSSALSHYGAAQLFLRYLDAQTAGGLPVGGLAQADAGDALQPLLEVAQARLPELQTFGDLYATWATANMLKDATVDRGQYDYAGLPRAIRPVPADAAAAGTVHQLGVDYLAWAASSSEQRIRWEGDTSVPVIPAPIAENEVVWWSGRGDARVSTLTSARIVPEAGATLRYRAWIDLEESYDYAYLTVSTDGGATWRSLPTPSSSADDPLGLNLGGGWTGQQTTWRDEEVSLQPWQGRAIQLRFWTITDEAYNTSGVALADLRIEGVAEASWEGAGFVSMRNQLPQEWELRGVLYPPTGPPTVVDLPVADGRAAWIIPANQRAVLVVVGATHATTELARYRYQNGP